MAFLSDSFQL